MIACNDAVTTQRTFNLISNKDRGERDFVVGFGYHISQLGFCWQEPHEATRTKQRGKQNVSEKKQ